MPHWIWFAYSMVAFVASCWFGWKATTIFEVPVLEGWSAKRTAQFWFNFVGSITGWAALFFVAYRVVIDGDLHHFEVWDALGVLVAFLGITGHLPVFIMQIVKWRAGSG
jgi:hypothetical protein